MHLGRLTLYSFWTFRQGCQHHPVRRLSPEGETPSGLPVATCVLTLDIIVAHPRFMYDGEHVEDNDTPGSLNMEDSDTIEVVLERESAPTPPLLPLLCSQEP